jgi:glycosyltransferase involved in cell wall biosynthesis
MRWVIASAAHRPEHGGIGSYVACFIDAAVAAGWEVHLLTREGDGHPPGAIVHEIRTPDDGPEFARRLDTLRRIDRVRPYRYGLWSCAVARKLLELDVAPDAIELVDSQAQGLVALESAEVRKRYRDVPMIVSAHTPMYLVEQLAGADGKRFGRHLYHDWERRALRAADGVIAPSRRLLEALEPVDASAVIPVPIASRPVRSGPGRTIVMAGAVEPVKGADTWLRSLPAVLERHDDVDAVLAGPDRPGPEGSWREHLAGELPARWRARVHFAGALDHDAWLATLDAAALVVVPSLFESFSYVAAEALAIGCPVVVSDRVGVAEIAPSLPVVPAGDADALARAQLAALADPESSAATALAARSEMLAACAPERLLELRRRFVERVRPGRVTGGDALGAMEAILADIERQERTVAPHSVQVDAVPSG